MSDETFPVIGELLPCFKCGKSLTEFEECGGEGMDLAGNRGQWKMPYGATEFTTTGHYGSTFWDSFEGESISINICDECCKKHIKAMRFRKYHGYNKSVEFIPKEYKDLL